MTEPEAPRELQLTDPRALRAMAHPIRLALIGLLRSEGPLTATRAGELLGESPASCSFHLRQLAKYGLVEEAGGGTGRQRPWRATAQLTHVPNFAGSADQAAASELFRTVLAERYFEQLVRWLERQREEPRDWQEAAAFGDLILYLTVEELAELRREVDALAERYLERTARRELRPAGARKVTFLRLAFPTPPLAGEAAGAPADRPATGQRPAAEGGDG